jgi:hypothetical protein
MVNEVRPVVIAKTLGVELSTFGGEFHVAQPPLGTVRTSTVEEKVRVSVPSVRVLVVDKLAPGIDKRVVPPVYAAVGVENVMNCANAGAAPNIPINSPAFNTRIFIVPPST